MIWGALHGLYLCVNSAFAGLCASLGWKPGETRGGRIAFMALTFLAVLAGWVLFRAQDLPSALLMLQAMAGFSPEAAAPLLRDLHEPILALTALAMIVWLSPNTQEIAERFESADEPTTIRSPVVFGRSRQFVWRPS